MDAPALAARMTATRPITTTYRVNLHTPRKPSPLNPAARQPPKPETTDERQSRNTNNDNHRESPRRARTVSPTQKLLRRKAAKTLQTNTLKRQVEEYEARALQSLATKTTMSSKGNKTKNAKAQETMNATLRVGITVTSSKNQQAPRSKRRKRWGGFWMLFRTRPAATAWGGFWPFSRRAHEIAWHPEATASPVAAAPAA
jgi:hypothetical protein